MNNVTFKAIPPINDFKLFFELEDNALSKWLSHLSKDEPKAVCLSILQFILTLNKNKVPPKKRILFLSLLSKALKKQIAKLEDSCWKNTPPFSSKEIHYAEIITWNYLALARGFFIAADSFIFRGSMSFPLAMALESLKVAQLHTAAVYRIPNKGFWCLSYQIFSLADKKDILRVKIGEINNITLNNLFAEIFIFEVANTKRYHPKEIRTLFFSLEQICHGLNICQDMEQESELFIFDLSTDSPPFNLNELQKFSLNSIRYFSPNIVVKNINNLLQSNTLANVRMRSLFRSLGNTLNLEQRRRHERQKKKCTQRGVVGFQNIIGFLYQVTKDIEINPIPAWKNIPKKNKKTSINQLKLYQDSLVIKAQKLTTLPDENAPQNKHEAHLGFKPNAVKVSLKTINIFDCSLNGYSVFWEEHKSSGVNIDADIDANVGDIFGLLSDDKKRLEIALIRRISTTDNQSLRFGVEVIGFNSEIVYIDHLDSQNGVGVWAILIPANSLQKVDTLVYQANEFKPEERAYLLRNQKKTSLIALKNTLNSTEKVTHSEYSNLSHS